MTSIQHTIHYSRSNGIILPVSLMFLLIMTIIGISNIKSTALGEKIVSNSNNAHLAFVGAESALDAGEAYLQTRLTLPSECTNNACRVWEIKSLPNISAQDNHWWQTHGVSIEGELLHINAKPTYVIEKLYFMADDLSTDTIANGQGLHYYQVTGHGVGADPNSEAIVQSTYVTRFN